MEDIAGSTRVEPDGGGVIVSVAVPIASADPIGMIADALGDTSLAQLFLFVGSTSQFGPFVRRAAERFADCPVTACTTAGEIGPDGYLDDHIVAVGLPKRHFDCRTIEIPHLADFDPLDLRDRVMTARTELVRSAQGFGNAVAFLLVDGLSTQEDLLLGAVFPALGATPLFGGSAGDRSEFTRTYVAHDGMVRGDAAVLTLAATDCDTRVFSLDHFVPTEQRMVITRADTANRIVHRINAEPAAEEYARMIGVAPDELDSLIFAGHPPVVRVGGTHHVRAIQRVTSDGGLAFFSAIDEGMVLSLAAPEDMARHLDTTLAALDGGRKPDGILACDCVLRRLQAQRSQSLRDVSRVLTKYGVRGFSTYGEQIGPLHVNHTMTGVAFYMPDGD